MIFCWKLHMTRNILTFNLSLDTKLISLINTYWYFVHMVVNLSFTLNGDHTKLHKVESNQWSCEYKYWVFLTLWQKVFTWYPENQYKISLIRCNFYNKDFNDYSKINLYCIHSPSNTWLRNTILWITSIQTLYTNL